MSEDEDRNSLGLSPSEEGIFFLLMLPPVHRGVYTEGCLYLLLFFCHGSRTVSSDSEHRLHVEP